MMMNVLFHVFTLGGMMLTPSVRVAAYLDPSVMTYTIQVVAGVVVAVGAVIGVYWRKAKKKVQDKMGIDENVKKEVEEDVVEFKDGESK